MSLHQSDKVINKLTKFIMKDGKKHLAMNILDDCFVTLRTKYQIEDPISFTRSAIENAKPVVETRKHFVGGRAVHVPTPCNPHRQQSLALRFIRDSFRKRKELGSANRLAKELVELKDFSGGAYKMRDDLHKRAEQNRGFAHFYK